MSSPAEDTGNGRISFTVKELLGKLDAKMDLFAVGLEAKANIEEMRRVEVRVKALEDSRSDQDAVEKYRAAAEQSARSQRRWIIGLVVAVLLAVIGLAGQVIYSLITS